MEDYLKAIYSLQTEDELVSTTSLASALDCTPASVTNMLQKLAELRLVNYTPYQGVRLAENGYRVALEVIRHHRLIELYLLQVLGFSWDTVHAEAERLEHVISEEFEDRIDAALGHPTIDPHGHPIPTKEGHLPSERVAPLSMVESGECVEVRQVSDRDPQTLRYLAGIGLFPEVRLRVLDRTTTGQIEIRIKGDDHRIAEDIAELVYVTALPPEEPRPDAGIPVADSEMNATK